VGNMTFRGYPRSSEMARFHISFFNP